MEKTSQSADYFHYFQCDLLNIYNFCLFFRDFLDMKDQLGDKESQDAMGQR